MSSDSEEDYMSMDFTTAVDNDVRPGLLRTNQQKREHQLLKRKQEFDAKSKQCKKKDLKVIEEEHREEGLNKPIEEGNKGFAMLAKMGYKAGGGIGKQDKPTALIDIKIKTSRKGLGLEEQRPRRKPSSSAHRQRMPRPDELSEDRLSDYRRGLSERLGERKLEGDLKRAQKICVVFDRNNGIEAPEQWWFWPPDELETHNEEEDDLEAYNESTEQTDSEDSEVDDEYRKQVGNRVQNDTKETITSTQMERATSTSNERDGRGDNTSIDDLNKYIALVGNLVRKDAKETRESNASGEIKGSEKDVEESNDIIKKVGNLVNSADKDSKRSLSHDINEASINRTSNHECNDRMKDKPNNPDIVNNTLSGRLSKSEAVSDGAGSPDETNRGCKPKGDGEYDRCVPNRDIKSRDISKDDESRNVNTNHDRMKRSEEDVSEDRYETEALQSHKEEEVEGHDIDDGLEEDCLSTQEKLSTLVAYLRRSHFYCVWCGARYEDPVDLSENCPGVEAEDH